MDSKWQYEYSHVYFDRKHIKKAIKIYFLNGFFYMFSLLIVIDQYRITIFNSYIIKRAVLYSNVLC